jgi:hypothetical protein
MALCTAPLFVMLFVPCFASCGAVRFLLSCLTLEGAPPVSLCLSLPDRSPKAFGVAPTSPKDEEAVALAANDEKPMAVPRGVDVPTGRDADAPESSCRLQRPERLQRRAGHRQHLRAVQQRTAFSDIHAARLRVSAWRCLHSNPHRPMKLARSHTAITSHIPNVQKLCGALLEHPLLNAVVVRIRHKL